MFGLLMQDNAPVDFPFRRSGASPEASVSLGRLGRRRVRYGIPPSVAARVPQYRGVSGSRFRGFGWVDDTGGGDDPAPLPGTAPEQEHSTWQDITTGILNLGTSITNAVGAAITPHSSGAGYSCPSGYVYSGGRCYPAQGGGGGGMGMGLALAAVGLGAAFLILRRK